MTRRSEATPAPVTGRECKPLPGEHFSPFARFRGIFIPEAVYKNGDLSHAAKLVYGRLMRYAGRDGVAFPSVATVGQELGFSESRARACLHELEGAGFIAIQTRQGTSNVYRFLAHASFAGQGKKAGETPPEIDRSTTPKTGSPGVSEPTARVSQIRQGKSITEEEQGRESQFLQVPESSVRKRVIKDYSAEECFGGNDADENLKPGWQWETFLRFWAVVPHQCAKNKAFKAWQKGIKSPAMADEVIRAMEKQAPMIRWEAGRNRHSIIHPATWLNQQRWSDQLHPGWQDEYREL